MTALLHTAQTWIMQNPYDVLTLVIVAPLAYVAIMAARKALK